MKEIESQREHDWEQTRQLWAIIANSVRDSKAKPTPFVGADLIKLSYDSEVKSDVITREKFEELKKRFGSKIKK